MTGWATIPTRFFLNDPSLGTMLVVRRVQVSFRTLVRGGPRFPGLTLLFHVIVMASSGLRLMSYMKDFAVHI